MSESHANVAQTDGPVTKNSESSAPYDSTASTAVETSTLTEKPLAAASRRLRADAERSRKVTAARHAQHNATRDPNPEEVATIATFKAQGITDKRGAKAMGIDRLTYRRFLKLPETQIEVAKRREILKALTIHRLGNTLDGAWDLTEATLKDKDPKGFDAVSRGLLNLEKISSSVSGEHLRDPMVNIQVQPQINIEEFKALILEIKRGGLA